MRALRTGSLVLAALFLAGVQSGGARAEAPAAAQSTHVVAGLPMPMAARYDPKGDRYLISGAPDGPQSTLNKGYIAVIDSGGRSARRWIIGGQNGVVLNAPKGMIIRGSELLVVDIDHIRMFDVESGKPLGAIRIDGATHLADLTEQGGKLYAVDPAAGIDDGAIFRVEGQTASLLARGPHLWRPAAIIALADGTLLVAPSIGSSLFQLSTAGDVVGYGMFPAQKMQVSVLRPTVRLGGLAAVDREIVATSWEGARVGWLPLNDVIPLDNTGTRHLRLMSKGSPLVQADVNRPEIKAFARLVVKAPADRRMAGNRRLPLYYREMRNQDFFGADLNQPVRMDFDSRRRLLIIPELGANRVSLVPVPEAPPAPILPEMGYQAAAAVEP